MNGPTGIAGLCSPRSRPSRQSGGKCPKFCRRGDKGPQASMPLHHAGSSRGGQSFRRTDVFSRFGLEMYCLDCCVITADGKLGIVIVESRRSMQCATSMRMRYRPSGFLPCAYKKVPAALGAGSSTITASSSVWTTMDQREGDNSRSASCIKLARKSGSENRNVTCLLFRSHCSRPVPPQDKPGGARF